MTSALLSELNLTERDAERILTIDARQIVSAAGRLGARVIHHPWRPVVDGTVLHTDTLAATRAGELDDVAVLMGTNGNEYDLFAMGRGLDRADPTVAVATNLTDPAALVGLNGAYHDLYAASMSPRQVRIQLMSAEEYWIPSVRFAEAHSGAGGRTWMYRFDWRPRPHPARLRASHMMELPFVFGTFDSGFGRALTLHAGASEHVLSQRIRTAWSSFAHHRHPSSEPGWSPYGPGRTVMAIDHEWQLQVDPNGAERRLWDGIL